MIKAGIRARLMAGIISAVVLITIMMVGFFSFHNRKRDKENAFSGMDNHCDRISSQIVSKLNTGLGRTRSITSTYSQVKRLNPDEQELFLRPFLLDAMEANNDYLAFWISFELNRIDPSLGNQPGRKTWLMDRLNDKLVSRTEFRGMNGIPESRQYLEIRQNKTETLIDPYWYHFTNSESRQDSILEATIAVPILEKDQVIGLAGIDFKLGQFDSIILSGDLGFDYQSLLVASDGTIISSSEKDQVGKNIASESLFGTYTDKVSNVISNGKDSGEIIRLKDGKRYYCSISPVQVGSSEKSWSVCMMAPLSVILSDANRVFLISLIIGLIGMILMGFLVNLISIPLVKPITTTTKVLDALSLGQLELDDKLEVHNNHELGIMAASVNRIQERFKAIASFASDIGRGRLDTVYPFDTDKDLLGHALKQMQTDLITLHKETERKDWFKTGLGGLNDVLRHTTDLNTTSKLCIRYIAKYLNAPIGALYLADESSRVLKLGAGYSFTKRKELNQKILYGEGLVGQCAEEKELIILTKIPEDYFPIKSATGSISPKEIVVIPCTHDDNLLAVLELGHLASFTEDELELLTSIASNIAIALQTVKAKEDMSILLARTLEQKEELQAQEEELREANQTLEHQAEELRRSEGSLQAQQEELRVTNQELEKNAQLLEEQSERIAEKNRALEIASHEIEEKARDLEQASRYKSEFLANMSHELRTPLNSMLILSQTLAANTSGNLSSDEIESAQIIFKSGTDLHNLINEILDLSKIEAGKMTINPEKVEVRQIADNINSLYRTAASEKGLEWTVSVGAGAPFAIISDQMRVEQIIKNLVSNALKFTAKGSIKVHFDSAAHGTRFNHTDLTAGKILAISVTDTGIGIDSEKQQVIFEAFQQADGSTSRRFGGTGLGLSISRELSRLLGGEIHLSSNPGQGSVFTLYLPFGESFMETPVPVTNLQKVDNQPVNITVRDEITPEATSSDTLLHNAIKDDRESIGPDSEHILVIEDDPEFARVLYKECHRQQFKCILAPDGETGYELAKRYRPAAIILDIKLPGIDGWKVLELIKRDPMVRHIPVHMMSSLDETMEAYQKGAIGYLKKPVTVESLGSAFSKIEHFLEKKMKQLLIVEDNEMLRKTMRQLLKGADIRITEVATAGECIESLRSIPYDCVILDLGLPDKSGLDLIRDIRELKLEELPPIIVYTGQELTREQNEELNKYTKSIIIKGVRSEERLLDEATLFLHRVVQDLPQQQQAILRKLYEKETTFDGKRILLVDDDMRNIFALSKVFEEKGIKVFKAENGNKALKILQEESGIDAVLMDIMMPEMDGYEAIHEIRKIERYEQTPIIALTAKAMKEDRQKCLDAGASDYISKPIEITRLLSLLRVWLKN